MKSLQSSKHASKRERSTAVSLKTKSQGGHGLAEHFEPEEIWKTNSLGIFRHSGSWRTQVMKTSPVGHITVVRGGEMLWDVPCPSCSNIRTVLLAGWLSPNMTTTRQGPAKNTPILQSRPSIGWLIRLHHQDVVKGWTEALRHHTTEPQR